MLVTQYNYCLKRPGATGDHIPPKQLWAKPRPSDLITVPACRICNEGFQKDDGYFRDCLALERRAWDHPDARAVTQNVLRGLTRGRRSPYARQFLSRTGVVEIRTAMGLYVGRQGGYHVDLERLGRTVGRVVRALYYHETREPLPLTYDTAGFFPEGFAHLPTWQLDEIRDKVIAPILRNPPKEVGRRVLEYRYARSDADPKLTAWILRFYGGIYCVGVSGPPELNPTQQRTGRSDQGVDP